MQAEMHSNKIWLIFLAAATLAAGWFSWSAIAKVTRYYSLQQKAEISDAAWRIAKRDEENYRVEADFSFEYGGNTYRGSELFEKPLYPNPWAAEYAMKKLESETKEAWFNPRNPRFSSLERKFPLKTVIYAITLLGLWLYFVWLGFYAAQFRR